MELVAKDHTQQGPYKSLQVRERGVYHRSSPLPIPPPPVAHAYGNLGMMHCCQRESDRDGKSPWTLNWGWSAAIGMFCLLFTYSRQID